MPLLLGLLRVDDPAELAAISLMSIPLSVWSPPAPLSYFTPAAVSAATVEVATAGSCSGADAADARLRLMGLSHAFADGMLAGTRVVVAADAAGTAENCPILSRL